MTAKPQKGAIRDSAEVLQESGGTFTKAVRIMCGIAGVFSFGDFRVTEPKLKRMCDSIRHRGPDGEGYWIGLEGRIGLGHRRLSIIDLSAAAAQPMSTPDGSVWIVFNGEIYNHAEIRRDLEALGDRAWRTDHSDTEVVLHAYQRWGIAALDRFRGMFAFALWDGRSRELYLVRDRIGVKPLYYTRQGRRLTFASEIKALLTECDVARAVNEDALSDYLSFMVAPGPETLFKDIFKLPPAAWLRIDADGGETLQHYWNPWDQVTPLRGLTEDELAERILAELREAVRYRKVSDVPVGVFLSGGVDSSTNAALFREGEDRPVRTFSVGYAGDNGSYRNEFEFARQVATLVGAEHHEISLDAADLMDFLPRMVWLQDEPIADPVCVPVHYVSRLARDNGVVVAQVGEGADELFCGYPRWRSLLKVDEFTSGLPHIAKSAGLAALRAAGMADTTPYEWLRRGSASQPIFWGSADAFKTEAKTRLLSRRLRAGAQTRTSWDTVSSIHRRFVEKAWDPSPLNWMTHMELSMRLPELLLMRVDKMSMGAGLEARVPFLDHKFVELALSIPSAMKLRGRSTKPLLKKAVRGIIPDAIIDRPKQPFGVPIEDWLLGALGAHARATIGDFVARTDLLDQDCVDALFRTNRSAHIWVLFNLAMWWQTFIAHPLPGGDA